MQLLSKQPAGSKCKIGNIDLPYTKKIKLLGLGVNTGTQISILRNRGGDMVVAMGNARVSIGRTIANFVEVS